jgi:hypothetical protein
MVKTKYFRIIYIVLFSGMLFVSGCDMLMIQDTGVLEGVISIGPICPVETDPPDPGCLPIAETFNAYPVSVWTTDGRIKITQINPALDGSYRAELATGNYLVILENDQNRIGSSNLPVAVSVIAQEKTNLDIDIDTGIR